MSYNSETDLKEVFVATNENCSSKEGNPKG